MDDRLLTIGQTAQQFNLTTGLLYTAIARGDLAGIRFRPRGRIRLREADVRVWIADHISGKTASGDASRRGDGVPPAVPNLDRFLPPQALRRFA
jgi:hypothetical protein